MGGGTGWRAFEEGVGGRLQKKRPLYLTSGVGGIKQMPSFQQRSSGMKSSSSVRFTIHFRNDAMVMDGKTGLLQRCVRTGGNILTECV